MLQSRYESAYRTYYELFNREADHYDPEGTSLACYNELLNYEIENRSAEEYHIGFLMDETGNNIESEVLVANYTQEKRPMDRFSEVDPEEDDDDYTGLMNDYYIPESHEEWNRQIYIKHIEQTGPMEVYDSYFNGYTVVAGEASKNLSDHLQDMHVTAMVTKCGYNAQFEIDKIGTEGIEEIH